jgi:hypothetical protein
MKTFIFNHLGRIQIAAIIAGLVLGVAAIGTAFAGNL